MPIAMLLVFRDGCFIESRLQQSRGSS
jgi:hypothetical protein